MNEGRQNQDDELNSPQRPEEGNAAPVRATGEVCRSGQIEFGRACSTASVTARN